MRFEKDRGAAAVEAGLLVAGIATVLVAVAALMGGEIESIFRAVLEAVFGG